MHEVLEYTLNNDPSILEAKENEIAAGYQVKSSQALNYPVVSVSANKNIFEKNRFKTNKNKKIEPALNTTLNIFSWGKISSTIKKDKEQEQYFHQEFFNKQEELGYQIAKLYIESLRSSEAIKAYEKNILRHRKIVSELEIITSHDRGRQSELVEAKTKLLSIETNIRKERKNLDLNLSQISKYINKELKEKDLEYPFDYTTAQDLVNKYADVDIKTNPLYLLQEAELKRQKYDVKAMQTHKLPNINLQSTVTKDDKVVFLNANWSLLDEVTRNSTKKGVAQLNAAYERLNQTTRDLQQQVNSSITDMHANEGVIKKSTEHLKSQEKVIESYELQYKIARRSLTDLLGAYSEISNIEMMKINSQKEYYEAILNYLKANAKIYEWFIGNDSKAFALKLGNGGKFVSHVSKEDQRADYLTNPTPQKKQPVIQVKTNNQKNATVDHTVNNQLESSGSTDDLMMLVQGKSTPLVKSKAIESKQQSVNAKQITNNEIKPINSTDDLMMLVQGKSTPLVKSKVAKSKQQSINAEQITNREIKPIDSTDDLMILIQGQLEPQVNSKASKSKQQSIEAVASQSVRNEAALGKKLNNPNLIKINHNNIIIDA